MNARKAHVTDIVVLRQPELNGCELYDYPEDVVKALTAGGYTMIKKRSSYVELNNRNLSDALDKKEVVEVVRAEQDQLHESVIYVSDIYNAFNGLLN